jgi:predicted Zn-dependent protease
MNLLRIAKLSILSRHSIVALSTLLFVSLAISQDLETDLRHVDVKTPAVEPQEAQAPEPGSLEKSPSEGANSESEGPLADKNSAKPVETEAPLSAEEKFEKWKKSTGLKGNKLKRHIALLQEAPPYEDEKLQAYVTKIGEKILAKSEHSHLPYKFILRDSESVNAFVTGTPFVYVERGLLAVLNSEAELAAVMAHELGHNIARHSSRLQARNRRNSFLATLASFAAGNNSVGSAIQAQSNVNLSEYRRENELEADSFAARYLFDAQYETSQMVNALAQLRDFNIFAASATSRGLPHHGLLATHPRSDVRLRKAIEGAGVFPPGESYIGRDEYREAINGMIYGPNYTRRAPPGLRRYTNETLGITFLHPKTWTRTVKGAKIVLKDADKTAQFKITIEKTVDKQQSSKDALVAKYPDILNPEKIQKDSQRDLGTLGAIPGQRVALAKVARNTFHFQGIAKDNNITPSQDAVFVKMIRSFRRMTPKDKTAEHITKVVYQRLQPGDNFASLAKELESTLDNAEAELRVLNGYYPKGEAEPGTWIKMLRKEKIED